MGKRLTFSDLFKASDINPYRVMAYLWSEPDLYQKGQQLGYTPAYLILLKQADEVDLAVRQYLAFVSNRLTRVYKQVDRFLKMNASYARLLIPIILECVRQTLLLNEWYELLPRFEEANLQIEQRFNL